MQLKPEAAIAEALGFLTTSDFSDTIGVAVSGGGDSMALLVLLAEWANPVGFKVRAVTVDHGLRPEAADEAAFVARFCAERGIAHDVLKWSGWDGTGNLMAEARAARRTLIEDWAEGHMLDAVLLGHTADDQVETFLMRLARGSGVDGLTGMASDDGLFLRPFLGVPRAVLRDVLTARGVSWIEDPTNDDPGFDRIKARRMLPELAELGLTEDRVLATMGHMRRAQTSLGRAAADFAKAHVRSEAGDLVFAPEALDIGRGDSPGRVLAAAIRWIGGRDYRPRYAALTDMAKALRAGETRTLNGVQMVPEAAGVRFTREFAAAAGPVGMIEGATLQMWDGRWGIHPPERGGVFRAKTHGVFADGLTIGALGEAVSQCPDWRATGLPRHSLMATPAVFQGETLIAAPVAGLQNGWIARIVAEFSQCLLSH